jgi:branched-chain amino acid transport system ATP-binding protein
MTPALSTEKLSVRYGNVTALEDVDLAVEPGQLLGLIGPNGAGKTTFIDALTGFARATGSVRLGDLPLEGMAPHQRARHGLARTWQSSMLFEDLTVAENLSVAAQASPWWRVAAASVRRRTPGQEAIRTVLDDLALGFLADRPISSLSQGQRKLVGVARALAARPTVVCLDEPAAGLDTQESEVLGGQLRQIVNAGTSMLLVDHDMGLVLSVCDEVVVLNFGRVIFRGPPDKVRSDPLVMSAYLGSGSTETQSGPKPVNEVQT